MSEYDYDDELLLDEEEDDQDIMYLTFSSGDEDFGISIIKIREIVAVQKITKLPDTPSYVKGVINLRGKTIPVIDLRLRFGLEEREYDSRTCIIIVELTDSSFGLIVDRVAEVVAIAENDINHQIRNGSTVNKNYISGIGKIGDQLKILLDIENILDDQLIDSIVKQS